MAITTLDGVLAGQQWPRYFMKILSGTQIIGRPCSAWGFGGSPGAGSYDTTLAGVALSSTSAQVNGQIPFTDPVSGNAYLSRFSGMCNMPGTLLLCDRLWHNGGFTITSTGSQTVNSATFPARDADGSTNGKGVLLGLEISAAAGAAAPTITVGYTNSDGTASRTGTNWFPTANSPVAGTFYPIGLQAGDVGVRSVQSLQLNNSWLSGTMNLVAYRVLASVELSAAGVGNAVDAITGGFPRLYNGTVPFLLWVAGSASTPTFQGQVIFAHG